jgi:hypothetical protein
MPGTRRRLGYRNFSVLPMEVVNVDGDRVSVFSFK